MILKVGHVYTDVKGNASDVARLAATLTFKDEDNNDLPLLFDNRFHSGLLKRVRAQLVRMDIDFKIQLAYKPLDVPPPSFVFDAHILPGITLRPYQTNSCKKFILHSGRGLLEAGTGAGKTEMAIALAKYLNVQTIFFCDRVFTMEQTYDRFLKYGLHVGRLGGGHRELDRKILVAVVDSLYSGIIGRGDREIRRCVEHADFLVVDEAHHGSTKTWSTVLENSQARYRLGMSASSFGAPDEVDFDDLRLVGLTGEIICKIPPRWLIDNGTCKKCDFSGRPLKGCCPSCGASMRGYLAEPLIYIHPVMTSGVYTWKWQDVYKKVIVQHVIRNRAIVSFGKQFVTMGMKVLTIVDRHEHGFNLVQMHDDDRVFFSFGGGRIFRKVRKVFKEEVWTPEQVRSFFDERPAGCMIGSSVFDEGVSLPTMNALILGAGGKSWRRAIQRIGRPLHSKDSRFVYVVDFHDAGHNFTNKHSQTRVETYSRLEYRIFRDIREYSKHLPLPLSV